MCPMPKVRSAAPVLSDQAVEMIAARFRVLGEPSRLRLIQSLEVAEKNVSELVRITVNTPPRASRG